MKLYKTLDSETIKLENDLIKLGFKRRWLSDKSGYWFEKNFKYKDLYMQLMVDTSINYVCLGVRVDHVGMIKLKLSPCYDFCYQTKLTIENVKKLIKRYK